jgi:hypothetical protein
MLEVLETDFQRLPELIGRANAAPVPAAAPAEPEPAPAPAPAPALAQPVQLGLF